VVIVALAAALAVDRIPPAYMATRPGLDIALVTGWIDPQFESRLAALLAHNPQVTVVEIESPGGLASQAYKAAGTLNRRGIELRVRGRCASACSLLWSSAAKRSLVEGALIGLHSGQLTSDFPRALQRVARRHHERRIGEVLAGAGFPPRLIAEGLATPRASMLWLSTEQLARGGVRFTLLPRKRPAGNGSGPNNSSKPTPLRGAA